MVWVWYGVNQMIIHKKKSPNAYNIPNLKAHSSFIKKSPDAYNIPNLPALIHQRQEGLYLALGCLASLTLSPFYKQ